MESNDYPVWREFGIPKYFVQRLRNLQGCEWLDFLVSSKVFHAKVKSQFRYTCHSCGTKKNINRIYEDYSICEQCSSDKITSFPSWSFSKCHPYSQVDDFSSSIIQKMHKNYELYFDESPSSDFISFKPVVGPSLRYYAKFICGEEVVTNKIGLSICKAAILSPFIWDDTYDWKHNYRRGEPCKKHIIPIINKLTYCRDTPKGRTLGGANWHPVDLNELALEYEIEEEEVVGEQDV